MTELKTSQYYHELADKLKFPTNAFIDGAFVNSVAGDRFVTRNPAPAKNWQRLPIVIARMLT